MKKTKKIAFTLIGCVFVVFMVLTILQWENIGLLLRSRQEEKDSILDKMSNQIEEQNDKMRSWGVTAVIPDESIYQGLLEGEISAEEANEQMGVSTATVTHPATDSINTEITSELTANETSQAEGTEQTLTQSTKANGSAETEPQQRTTALPTAQDYINQCAEELYRQQIDIIAQLGALKKAYESEWKMLPVGERTAFRKTLLIERGLRQCVAWESKEDKLVESILGKYRVLLEGLSADTAALDSLWRHYCDVKATTKEYYLNMLQN